MTPYEEIQESENTYIRTFSQDIPEGDLKWHWDEEDRIIEAMEPTDWTFQFDNDLPQPIAGQIYIPKGVIHRIIKGTGDFQVRVTKIF
jgi:hypothetical protein